MVFHRLSWAESILATAALLASCLLLPAVSSAQSGRVPSFLPVASWSAEKVCDDPLAVLAPSRGHDFRKDATDGNLASRCVTINDRTGKPVRNVDHQTSHVTIAASLPPDQFYFRSAIQFASDKEAAPIFATRERALGILSEENACSEWFHAQDPHAAETFATLQYALDRRGQEYVTETRSTHPEFLSPWVAKVMQEGGAYQTVAVNFSGAFFRSSAYIRIVPQEGGPILEGGARAIRVGPYLGGTPEAQLTTILHEFGHVIGLLGYDGDGLAEKSVLNTSLVLQHCQTQIADATKKNSITRLR